jgi:hypothetical protein
MSYLKINRVELYLFGVTGRSSLPDRHRIWIDECFFENWLHWQFKVEKISINGYFRVHIYLRTNRTLIYNYLYVFDNWGKI